MKIYPVASSLTIRQRLEQLVARRSKTAKDVWVNVYDNSTGYSPENFGFYLSDWNSPYDCIQAHKALDYRLDSVTRSEKILNLGFTHFRKNK